MSRSEGRLEHLLIDRATVGLTANEQRELQSLAGGADDFPEEFELAAAAVELACSSGGASGAASSLPNSLRTQLGRTARDLFG